MDIIVNCTVASNFLLDKGRVAENLQKECFCYFIIIENVLFINFNKITKSSLPSLGTSSGTMEHRYLNMST